MLLFHLLVKKEFKKFAKIIKLINFLEFYIMYAKFMNLNQFQKKWRNYFYVQYKIKIKIHFIHQINNLK